ncbi:CoA ligase [Melia azedarach]|uniref:CoA ligase n=1 Tax=Melia azedarach TaxID=155640 RepID=A0ACC1WR33_MELAZ|nr:CoA ligase [Melia azedarach]
MDQLKPKPVNSCPLTPLGFLERAATVYGDSPSVVYNDTTYTWSQTHRRCLLVAASLSSIGITTGDVVSVLAPNIPAAYELHFAVPMSGAILNTINTRLDARTISVILQHSESKLVFVDHLLSSVILEALSLFPPHTKSPRLVLISDHDDEIVTTHNFIDTYENMLRNGDPGFNWVRPKSEWDPVVLNYTSGTTSSPKGVVQCHRALFVMVLNSLIDWALPNQPVYLWTLPMFHNNGWSFTWGLAAVGATNICLRKIDAPAICSLIKKHGVTHMCGAPVLLNMLSNSLEEEKLAHPVHILTAGSPPPAPVLLRAKSLGFMVSHGYGLTETAGVVISCAWKPHWNKLPATERARLKARQGIRTIGLTEVDVVDPKTGLSVKRDGLTRGEIVMRGGSLMLGYLKDKESTSKCMKDGWFFSGDVAVRHPDGYIEIKDRSKDVIKSGGENISSAEVESILYSHPLINEAAVVARPDPFWQETPCPFVVLKKKLTEKPTEKEIIEFCRYRLAHYMVPKTVVFMDELPKTSTGKIQKFLLKDIASSMFHSGSQEEEKRRSIMVEESSKEKMNLVANKQVILNAYVKGFPKETDFGLKSSAISFSIPNGAVLLKNLYLSCDPYMRHRMSNHISHPGTIIHSFTPGSVLVGYGIGKVIKSANPDFEEGEFLWGLTGWEEYTMIPNPESFRKVKYTDVPLSYYMGILGSPGLAAYVGFFNLCSPKKGETVYVSTASGGVGQLVGQFAKMAGCYVVGSASTQEKVNLAKQKFGYDDAFNYKEEPDLRATLDRYFPEGIDIYFDNVGGEMLDEVLLHMKPHGRIAACGMISQYNLDEQEGIRNMFNVVIKRLEIKGYVETDYKHVYPEFLEFAIKNLEEKKLVYVEDIAEGLENGASALVGIFYGKNVGKQLVRVAAE